MFFVILFVFFVFIQIKIDASLCGVLFAAMQIVALDDLHKCKQKGDNFKISHRKK